MLQDNYFFASTLQDLVRKRLVSAGLILPYLRSAIIKGDRVKLWDIKNQIWIYYSSKIVVFAPE